MNKLVAKLSQLKANQSEHLDLESNAEQIQRKQLPFFSMIGAQKINLEKETSNFLQRGSLDSAGLLRALENKDQGQNLSEKEKALYQIFNKKEINLRNSAEANLAIYILRKQIKNNLEMRFLQQVIQNISIFKQNPGMASDSLISSSLFKQLKHEFYPRRTVLFNYGDTGDKYYIVLKGSVYCLLPDSQLSEEQRSSNKSMNLQQIRPHTPQSNRSQNQQEQQEKEDNPKLLKVLQNITAKKKTLALFSKLGMAQNFLEEIREEQALTDEEYIKKKFADFKPVKQIGPGESFGEIALMTNKGRTATIILKEDTHFMSLSKEGFNKVFSIYKAKILEDQIQFLHNFTFFRDLSKFSLLQLLYHFKIEIFSCKQVIYSQKDNADKLYLVHRGEIEISKKYIIKENQNEPQYLKNNFISRHSGLKITQDENKYIIEKSADCGSERKQSSLKRKNQIQKTITISKVGSNSYFGEYEIVNGKSLRETQARCSSVSSEIYIIDIKKLKQILSEKEYKMLQEESKVRIDFQEKRMEQSINLKENQTQILKQNNGQTNNKTVNEFYNQHSAKALTQKRNSLYEKQQKIQENYDLPQPSNLVKGGLIVSKEFIPQSQTSRTDDDQSIPQTPKTIFPSSIITRKSFTSSTKDSTMTSSLTTRQQSQTKQRSSLQNIQDNFNSVTQILSPERNPFQTTLQSLSSTQIPFTNNKIKRTLTLQQTNGYIPGLYSQKSLKNIPVSSMVLHFKNQKKDFIDQESEPNQETSKIQEQKNNNNLDDEIQKLKEVYQMSVKRGVMLKEYSKRLMVQQLVEKPKQNLINQILRNKRQKITGNSNLYTEQKSVSFTQISQSGQTNLTKQDFATKKKMHHIESTPNITSLNHIKDCQFAKSPLNKNNSIILQQSEVRIPAFNE